MCKTIGINLYRMKIVLIDTLAQYSIIYYDCIAPSVDSAIEYTENLYATTQKGCTVLNVTVQHAQ